jgi:transcriptional regulator with XRE-family HTH domain
MSEMSLGARLRAVREDRKISRADVAKALACHPTNIAHIESDRHRPSVEQLQVMARLFGCTIDALVQGPLPIALDEPPPAEQAEAAAPPADAKSDWKWRKLVGEGA